VRRPDEDLEGELVGRPEDRYHELLRAGRLEVDDGPPDGEDRRRDTGNEAGEELARGDGGSGRDEAGDGRPGARGAPESADGLGVGTYAAMTRS
jgi:hypothetical protein